MKTWIVLSLFLAAAAYVGVLPAVADDTECVGVLRDRTPDNVVVPSGAHCEMLDAQVMGNVLVLPGASLRASRSTIMGNVQGDDSRFVCLQGETRVGGNLQVKGGAFGTTTGFDIATRVMGDAKVEDNEGHTFIDAAFVGGKVDVLKNRGSIEIEFNLVGGDVKIEDNLVPPAYTGAPPFPAPTGCGIPSPVLGMSAFGNNVGANMQVFKNVGRGPKQVVNNMVREDLQCGLNSPPFVGGPNIAGQADPPPGNQCTAAVVPR